MDLIIKTIPGNVAGVMNLEVIGDHNLVFAEFSLPIALKSVTPKLAYDYNKPNVPEISKIVTRVSVGNRSLKGER